MAKAVEEPLLRNESHESHKTVEQMLVRTYDNNKDIDVLRSSSNVQNFQESVHQRKYLESIMYKSKRSLDEVIEEAENIHAFEDMN